ncbi:MAG: hypothetical protein FWH37_01965 [Candidatus Bathyarchaeota archaeon]|nr:hypothetical protein [Candidatus Termiticorpusculum sp.]
MRRNIKFKIDLHSFYNRKAVFLVSLLLMVSIGLFFFISAFENVSPFVSGISDIVVSNEIELKNAITDRQFDGPVVIALDKDITITDGSLIISAFTNITLTSNKASGFYKLIGATTAAILQVDSGGILIINGIIITHTNGTRSCGVVNMGTLIMRAGEISDNYVGIGGSSFFSSVEHSYGGGVMNAGVFEMYGGKISGNNARAIGNGGGVYNGGGDSIFMMYGGEISGNTATNGGGVCNGGIFVMFGGEILGNTAEDGGGVCNWGNFTIVGGSITSNTADYGGGVYNRNSVLGGVYFFDAHGGKILDNVATYGDNDDDVFHDTDTNSSSNRDTPSTVVPNTIFIGMMLLVRAVVIVVILIIALIVHDKRMKKYAQPNTNQ